MDTLDTQQTQPLSKEDLISIAKNARFTSIPHLSEADVSDIWLKHCGIVAANLSNRKGVAIPNLGTLAISKQSGGPNAKEVPVFILSEKLAHLHKIHVNTFVEGSYPVVPFNFSQLSIYTGFDRATCENCIREVVQAVSRHFNDKRGISLVFHGIGKLAVKHGKVRFKFAQDIAENIGNLLHPDRPLSRMEYSSRPGTIGTYSFDRSTLSTASRCSSRGNTPRLLGTPDIFQHKQGLGATTPQEATRHIPLPSIISLRRQIADDEEDQEVSPHETVSMPPIRSNGRTETDITNKIRALPDDVLPKELSEEEALEIKRLAQRNLNSTFFVPTEVFSEANLTEKRVDWEHGGKPRATLPPPGSLTHRINALSTPPPTPHHDHTTTCTSKMCYVCHQRSKIEPNPSIQLAKTLIEEETENSLLAMNERLARKAFAAEKLVTTLKDEEIKKTAEYNHNVALFASTMPKEKDEVTKADVFAYRPATSHEAIRHMNQLHASHLSQQANNRAYQEFLAKKQSYDRQVLEQEAITRQLQAARLAQNEFKAKTKVEYQVFLDKQISEKEAQQHHDHLADEQRAVHANPTVFPPSRYALDGILEAKRLEEEQDAYEAQIEQEAEKKRKLIAERRAEKETRAKQVEKIKADYIEDLILTGEQRLLDRMDLERDWKSAADLKHKRDAEEEAYRAQGAKLLLLEQTDPYDRCGQCQRDISNNGKTNIEKKGIFMQTQRTGVYVND